MRHWCINFALYTLPVTIGLNRPDSPMAEAEDLKSSQCGFDPHSGQLGVAPVAICGIKFLSNDFAAFTVVAQGTS